MKKPYDSPQYLVLGEILRPHGVRGELRMKVLTDYPERLINDVKTIFLGSNPNDSQAVPYTITAARFHKTYLLLKLKEVPDRNAAERLRGYQVMVHIDDAIPLEEDEFYLYELIGLRVQTHIGQQLGTIQNVIETGANDVYVVNGSQYGELLIPAHDGTLQEIDLDEGQITVILPDGLLPDETAQK